MTDLKPRPPCLKLDSDLGVGPSSMERGTTSSTLDSPFGSQLNTPIDEKFQNQGGILRIQSSDFAQVEAEDKDGLVKEKAATTAVESRNEDTVYDPPFESRLSSERSARTSQESTSATGAIASDLFSSINTSHLASSKSSSSYPGALWSAARSSSPPNI
ncbi:hypothetical protein BDN71DRAFT_1510878 [Pleurotus eryngii]|uniref:Uncharacterized protein n=1 Tax=Pleurotus eryngii TaxID=5323 RepID=A0A9P5ZN69_PLEER|nr:hypothetical protein BDN71DRAFT_1510878 [Pleurotus eryngii]